MTASLGADANAAGPRLMAGGRFGRYTIVRLIGAGGMGAVYEATQDSPRRSVALKVIRSSYLSAQMLRRFEHESQVLGRLQHPGIAQVYEAGSVHDAHAEGAGAVPFFAMELIKGVPLTEYAAAKRLGTRERLELVARICEAVDHAHQKGVIHRDLKPANILVDESGQPKILDFGVARATDSDIQQTTMQTDIGQLIGTVPYMSPEQVGGDPDALDTRSDVYALGVLAYELLAGRLPHDLQKKMIHEAVRVIREDEPTRLSSINRTLRGDVETIVGHALEKDKTRRYQSADALGTDIRRYLKDEPIAARPASTWYHAAKFARRNKVLVVGVAATFVVLVAGIIGVSLSLNRALTAESDLTDQIGETTAALAAAKKAEGEATVAKNTAVSERDAAEYEAYVAQLAVADSSLLHDQPAQLRASLDACPERRRGWEWRYLNALSDTSSAVVRIGGDSERTLDVSQDGELFAFTHAHASVSVYKTRSAEEVVSFEVGPLAIRGVTFSGDGKKLLVQGIYNEMFVYDPITGARLTEFKTGGVQHYDAAFSPDGALVVICCKDGCARVMDSVSGMEVLRLGGHAREVTCAAFRPDGERVLTGARDGTLRLWTKNGELVREIANDHEEVMCLAFSPAGGAGGVAMSGGRDGKCRLWNTDKGDLIATMPMAEFPVFCCAFAPDGTWCAAGEQTGEVIVWETLKGEVIARMEGYNRTEGHKESVQSVRFGKDRERLLTASADKTARIWQSKTGRQLAVLHGHTGPVWGAIAVPSGGPVLTFSSDGTARLWRLAQATGETLLRGHEHVVLKCEYSWDGQRIGTISVDKTARVWNATSGECTSTYTHGRAMTNVSFTPDGATMLVGSVIAPSVLIDTRTAEVIREFGSGTDLFVFALLNPSGDRVLCGLRRGGMTVFDAESGAQVYAIETASSGLVAAAYSPDGSRFATISGDGRLDQWNAADGSPIEGLREGNGPVGDLAYSPDGRTIAIGSFEGAIYLRNSVDGSLRMKALGHDDRIEGIGYSPDGMRLVTASHDRTARIWDSETLRLLATIRAHNVWVNDACFSPDGLDVLTAASDATARIHHSVPVSVRLPIATPSAKK